MNLFEAVKRFFQKLFKKRLPVSSPGPLRPSPPAAVKPEPVPQHYAPSAEPARAAKFPERKEQSPNWSRTNSCEGVVIHHSAGSFAGSVSWCLQSKSQVSYHCIIDTDGSRVQLCKDKQRAWHAGKSSFKGRQYCNGFMLGLSFSGNTYQRKLTQAEILSAIEWIEERWEKYGWDISCITDHRTVSPGRKDDLNPVEFERLMEAIRDHFRD